MPGLHAQLLEHVNCTLASASQASSRHFLCHSGHSCREHRLHKRPFCSLLSMCEWLPKGKRRRFGCLRQNRRDGRDRLLGCTTWINLCSSHSRAKITSKWGFAVLRRNLGTTYHAGPLGVSVDQIGETRSHEAANRCLFVPYAWNPQVPVGPRYLVEDSSFEKKTEKKTEMFFF